MKWSYQKIMLVCMFSANLTIKAQERWIERNAKHIVACSSILLPVAAAYVYEFLASKIFKTHTLNDSDPCKQFCVEQLIAMNVANPTTVTIKVTGEIAKNNARSKCREIDISKEDYDSFSNGENFDKGAFQFLLRHECSHIKNNDLIKGCVFNITSFNALLYGMAFLAQRADQKKYMPANTQLRGFLKTWAPILAAFAITPYISNLYGSTLERRADKNAATDLLLANAGVRWTEGLHLKHKTDLDYQRGRFVSLLIRNPLLHRCIVGYERDDIRIQRLRDYAAKFEKTQS